MRYIFDTINEDNWTDNYQTGSSDLFVCRTNHVVCGNHWDIVIKSRSMT